MPRLARAVTALSLAAVAACGSSGGGETPAPGPGGDLSCTLAGDDYGPDGTVPIRVERIASGLEVPWGIAFLPGGDALVTERPGRVRLLRADGRLEPDPVLAIDVSRDGEAGLLGIAADPRFAENRRFYLYYTVAAGDSNRVVRYVLSEDRRSAQEDRVLVDGIPAASVHDGGRVRFGPDGMLYASTGDASAAARSQDPATLAGKILRIGTDGEAPPDNPTPGSRVLVSGVRNVQGFDWLDASTLVVADHGPSGELGRSAHDEVSVVRPGANLGWPAAFACGEAQGTTTPVLVFQRAAPPGGGSVYRGGAIPAWNGSFLVGTLGSRLLVRVVLSPEGERLSHEIYLRGQLGRLRDVVEAPDGSLWITTSNCDGRGTCPPERDVIVRIVGG